MVASEVKSLASQTAKATDEISNHISGMQGATQESVAAIKEIGGTIGQISDIASTIASAVEQQGAATQEIARSVQNVAQGTQEAATNIMQVNRGATETGSASEEVLNSARSAVERKHAPARRARSLHGEYQGGVSRTVALSRYAPARRCHHRAQGRTIRYSRDSSDHSSCRAYLEYPACAAYDDRWDARIASARHRCAMDCGERDAASDAASDAISPSKAAEPMPCRSVISAWRASRLPQFANEPWGGAFRGVFSLVRSDGCASDTAGCGG